MGESAPSEQPAGAIRKSRLLSRCCHPTWKSPFLFLLHRPLGRIPRIRTSNTHVKCDCIRIFIKNDVTQIHFRRLSGPYGHARPPVMSPTHSCRFKEGSIFETCHNQDQRRHSKEENFKEAHFLSASCTVARCQGPIIVMRV